MKKLLAVLICAFAIAGCAITEKSPYEIDPVATANAPWEVGEKIGSVFCFHIETQLENCFRVFVGVSSQGFRVVQDFYDNGNKETDPYLIRPDVSFFDLPFVGDSIRYLDAVYGSVTAWYRTGEKKFEIVEEENESKKFILWYENGQMAGYMEFSGGAILVFKEWDESGNLIREIDNGYPEE